MIDIEKKKKKSLKLDVHLFKFCANFTYFSAMLEKLMKKSKQDLEAIMNRKMKMLVEWFYPKKYKKKKYIIVKLLASSLQLEYKMS